MGLLTLKFAVIMGSGSGNFQHLLESVVALCRQGGFEEGRSLLRVVTLPCCLHSVALPIPFNEDKHVKFAAVGKLFFPFYPDSSINQRCYSGASQQEFDNPPFPQQEQAHCIPGGTILRRNTT